ncbi:MAG: hypothetical protein CM15mP109_14480 [Candidatus Dadabacteria bacterium]|nr:MAG: hypothetical protein CM15mP109_14480 [Candidatus Dadabacteria bacterium]
MKNDEILIVQDYLRITFGNEEIQIRKSENEDNLNSIFIITPASVTFLEILIQMIRK